MNGDNRMQDAPVNPDVGTQGAPAPDLGTQAAYGVPLLDCQNLNKSFVPGVPVLHGLSFALGRGRILGVLGPNGSGKTTLLKLIAGLLTPNSGTIAINGLPVGVETKKLVAYLPDRSPLDEGMKVSALVRFYADFFADFDPSRAEDLLGRLSIPARAKLGTLSKGNREKVRLILTMSRRAQLYLLDEPIGGVDPAARDYILDTILSNYGEGASILLSTHLIRDVEPVLNDVMFLANGGILLASTVDEIHAQGRSVDDLFREVYRC